MWLNLCSAVRKSGDFRSLYPRGIETVHDVPWFLQEAIQQGMVILSWYENNAEEDIPPEYIWEDGQALEQWWKRVAEKRGYSTSGDTIPDDSDMMDNELVRQFKDF